VTSKRVNKGVAQASSQKETKKGERTAAIPAPFLLVCNYSALSKKSSKKELIPLSKILKMFWGFE
jgi:hypothetical protein